MHSLLSISSQLLKVLEPLDVFLDFCNFVFISARKVTNQSKEFSPSQLNSWKYTQVMRSVSILIDVEVVEVDYNISF